MSVSVLLRLALVTLVMSSASPLYSQEADESLDSTKEAAPSAEAREDAEAKARAKVEAFGWTRSGKAKIGSNAEIDLPEGLQLTGADGAKKLLQMFGNLASGQDLAILSSNDLSWWATFQFEADGYVKDDEKDKIDADAILATKREEQDQGNRQRTAKGLNALTLTGWAVPPFYNEATKSLEYGLRVAAKGREQEGESVNYNTKILGRRGWMDVQLVCDPDQLEPSLAALRGALNGFHYLSGETYAEYRKGDKVSEYGIAALLGAGTLAVAAKTGLLAKFWKVIVVAFLAVAGVIKKVWSKITGRGNG